MGLLFTGLLILIGLFFGMTNERRHETSMTKRMESVAHIVVTNLSGKPSAPALPGQVIGMSTGSTVIAFDYFKTFIAGFILMFGGRITVYEKLLDRARREAFLRLLEDAHAQGATAVHGIRYEFSRVGARGGNSGIGGGAELLCYGTAVRA